MGNREEKKQARIERYEQYARNAENQSTEAYNCSNSYVSGIPLGQPIQVGHYSEKRHRNALNKSWDAMGRSVKLAAKAEYFKRKAEAAANNDAIYTEDEDAEERLTAKIAELERAQEFMKAVNKIVRNKKIADAEKISRIQKLGVNEDKAKEILTPDYCNRIGFPAYALQNNNANLIRYKQRLEQIKKLKTAESKEYEKNGVRVVENTEENRLQLFYPGKPDEETRKKLKSHGFRWSPYNKCWQAYLSQKWKLRYLFDEKAK